LGFNSGFKGLTEAERVSKKVSIPATNRGKHDWMQCDFHFECSVLVTAYKQQACCAVWSYATEWAKSRSAL